MLLKKLYLVLTLVLLSAALIGCEGQIFEEEEELTLTRYDKTSLLDGKYYIKDGTGFFEPYMATATFNSSFTTASNSRVIWSSPVEEILIPTLYKGESLVYVSSSEIPESVRIERFKDCGFTIGIMGFAANETAQMTQYSTVLSNLKTGSDAYEKLYLINATKITIADIDGKEVDSSSFTYGGILNGMDYGQEYDIGLYVGSFYKSHSIKADTRVLASDSVEELEDISLTKNGYFLIHIPEDMPSGYYYLHEHGLFRYINTDKRTAMLLENIDYNEDLKTTSGDSGLEHYNTIEKEFTLDKECEYMVLTVNFASEKNKVNKITVITPDGEKFLIKEYKGEYTHTIDAAIPGTYKVEVNAIATEKEVVIEQEIIEKVVIEETEKNSQTTESNEKDDKTKDKDIDEATGSKSEDKEANNTEPDSSEKENKDVEEKDTSKEETSQTDNPSNEENTEKQEYEWIQVIPEPLDDAEISDTQPAD